MIALTESRSSLQNLQKGMNKLDDAVTELGLKSETEEAFKAKIKEMEGTLCKMYNTQSGMKKTLAKVKFMMADLAKSQSESLTVSPSAFEGSVYTHLQFLH